MLEEKISVMIVDDHPMVRQGLAMFVDVNADMHLVGEANNLDSGLKLYLKELPDVILVDMVLANESGVNLIKKIRAKNPRAAIIALTSFDDEKIVAAALQAGARGFLHKNVSVKELSDAIRKVHLGHTILDPRASEMMQNFLKALESPTIVQPSQRELEVLQLLVEGLTNKQIASELDVKASTVKQYVSNLLVKLKVQSRAEAVAVALKYKLVE